MSHTEPNNCPQIDKTKFVRDLSAQDFLSLGVQHIAYIKPVQINGRESYSIHAADGSALGFEQDIEEAVLLVMEHSMAPVTVH